MNEKFIRSLPLVASALGRKYGLRVIIGGQEAATDGGVIMLPTLPLDSPPEMMALARGFLDHEAAHIRDTDFKLVKKAKLSPLEQHLWNIIEDWRVEGVLGRAYPGCRDNFQWLIRHLFVKPPADDDSSLDIDLLNWLLLKVRSWTVPELSGRLERLRRRITAGMPNVLAKLEPILEEIRAACPDTRAAVAFARRINKVLRDLANITEQPASVAAQGNVEGSSDSHQQSQAAQGVAAGDGDDPDPGQAGGAGAGASAASQTRSLPDGRAADQTVSVINSLMSKPAQEMPRSVGEMLSQLLSDASQQVTHTGGGLEVARDQPRSFGELSPADLQEARSGSLALRCRLQSLLQTMTLKRRQAGHRGRLDPNRLAALAVGDSKVFRRSSPRTGLDTAIHLLMDASGSMSGMPIHLVSLASYSLSEALRTIPGVSLGATFFPGGHPPSSSKKRGPRPEPCNTVASILEHGQKPHRKFSLAADGNTPLGEALWRVMQKMSVRREKRKIILILTDGEPDSRPNALAAIKEAGRQGFEVYGLGLKNESIRSLLPGRSLVIKQLADLPTAMFGLLGTAITGKENT